MVRTVATGATLNFQDHLSTGGINSLFGGGTVNIGTASTTMLTVNSGNFAGSIAGIRCAESELEPVLGIVLDGLRYQPPRG